LFSPEVRFLLNSLTVVGALLLLYYLVNRFGPGAAGFKKGKELELLEKLPINSESGLIVFRAGREKLLAYYSKNDFKVIKEIKDEGTADFNSNTSASGGVGRDS
jgi:hypothetical protein